MGLGPNSEIISADLALARLTTNCHNVQGIQGAHERRGTLGEDSLHCCWSLAHAPRSTMRMATWLVRDRCHPALRLVPFLSHTPPRDSPPPSP
jgi:hypothetical protein